MFIPTPEQMKSSGTSFITKTEERFVERIIDEFLTAVKHNEFHLGSNNQESIVFYPVEQPYCKKWAFDRAVTELNKYGWSVSFCRKTCVAGWYNAIVLTKK